MEINVIAFGQIAEIFGKRSLQLHGVDNTRDLRNRIETTFPDLKDLNYLIAVDRTIINQDVAIGGNSEIALLPPFSGG